MLAMEDTAEKAMLYQNTYQRKRSSIKLVTLESFAWLFLEEQINCAEFWFFSQLAVGVVKLNKIVLNFDSFIRGRKKDKNKTWLSQLAVVQIVGMSLENKLC